MLSLVAEPLAGIVDTAFVERLGAPQAAALGAATALLSGVLWVFNFLGVGTQTEVARAAGDGRPGEAGAVAGLALVVAVALGTAAGVALWLGTAPAAAWMSGDAEVQRATVAYLEIRLLGFPAGLVSLAAFGALRGLEDMRTPMWIAGGMSLANGGLDAVLVFGWGPVPGLGIAGAAWATTGSQVAAAAVAWWIVARRLGARPDLEGGRVLALFVVGRDMVIRTGALLLFMILATRVSLQMGAEAGAGHQAIRQVWMLLAFLLDAYAASAQSLVAWFLGARRIEQARRVARVGVAWGVGTGLGLALLLWLGQPAVAALLVPPGALDSFARAWPIFVLSQPLAAVSFVTDGIHWGTADYAYLRNAMLSSSVLGLAWLVSIDTGTPDLVSVWVVTLVWVGVRAAFGVARVWPGIGRAPLSRDS